MGGGLTLSWITDGQVPEWVGGLVICTVVMIYVTYGGLRGTAWANTFPDSVFMVLGAATFIYVINAMGGLGNAISQLQEQHADLLVRGDHFSPIRVLTYTLIPLSAGMFPHMFMHWLTASKLSNFRITLVAYPICIAIVWVPSVLMGLVGNLTFPNLSVPASNSILVRLISSLLPRASGGAPGRRGFRRGDVFTRLAGSVARHHVHPGHRATLRATTTA